MWRVQRQGHADEAEVGESRGELGVGQCLKQFCEGACGLRTHRQVGENTYHHADGRGEHRVDLHALDGHVEQSRAHSC